MMIHVDKHHGSDGGNLHPDSREVFRVWSYSKVMES